MRRGERAHLDADFGSEGARGGAPAASPARPGSCSARASPAATIAAWNSGGPVTRLSRITVICARRGGRAQARRARARALVPRPTLPTLMSPCAPDSSMLCRCWVRPCRAAARPGRPGPCPGCPAWRPGGAGGAPGAGAGRAMSVTNSGPQSGKRAATALARPMATPACAARSAPLLVHY